MASPLPRACIALTKSEEKERLLAVYTECIECFHMTSRRPCWEFNTFLMQTLSFVPINLHRRWVKTLYKTPTTTATAAFTSIAISVFSSCFSWGLDVRGVENQRSSSWSCDRKWNQSGHSSVSFFDRRKAKHPTKQCAWLDHRRTWRL